MFGRISPRPGFDFLDPHHIGVRRKLEVVLNADRRQDESDLARELAAQTLDLVGQAEAFLAVLISVSSA